MNSKLRLILQVAPRVMRCSRRMTGRPQQAFTTAWGVPFRLAQPVQPNRDSIREEATRSRLLSSAAPPVTGSMQGHDPGNLAALPPAVRPETEATKDELAPQLRRTLVDYQTKEPAGTIIIDTPNTYLYLVIGDGKALRYGIGVGREGFTWSGAERVTRMLEWPDWTPPEEMIARQPYLPRFMAGGETNPLGARALYLGNTIYRIHGTNQPSTIGTFVSSGCIRLTNEDVMDLHRRVRVGTPYWYCRDERPRGTYWGRPRPCCPATHRSRLNHLRPLWCAEISSRLLGAHPQGPRHRPHRQRRNTCRSRRRQLNAQLDPLPPAGYAFTSGPSPRPTEGPRLPPMVAVEAMSQFGVLACSRTASHQEIRASRHASETK